MLLPGLLIIENRVPLFYKILKMSDNFLIILAFDKISKAYGTNFFSNSILLSSSNTYSFLIGSESEAIQGRTRVSWSPSMLDTY